MSLCNSDVNDEDTYEQIDYDCLACGGSGTGLFDDEGNFVAEIEDSVCPWCAGSGVQE